MFESIAIDIMGCYMGYYFNSSIVGILVPRCCCLWIRDYLFVLVGLTKAKIYTFELRLDQVINDSCVIKIDIQAFCDLNEIAGSDFFHILPSREVTVFQAPCPTHF